MPDDLYERDILAWSEHQADLLRRLGRGERVNDVDWANLAEEIEDVGRSQLQSVDSFLTLMMLHLLKLHAWPDSDARNHWRGEVIGFQTGANRAFTSSMRQKIDIDRLHADALRRLTAEAPKTRFPSANPFTVDDLLTQDMDALLSRLPPSAA
jgi:hypothetical protein